MNESLDFRKIRALIEVPEVFDLIKEKYPEVEPDIISWRENPNCECGRRVQQFFNEKFSIKEDKDFLNILIDSEEVQKKLDGINKGHAMQYANQIPEAMTDYRGKIFTVGKTEDDWADFWQKIIKDRAAYRTFSLLESEDKLKVYFL